MLELPPVTSAEKHLQSRAVVCDAHFPPSGTVDSRSAECRPSAHTIFLPPPIQSWAQTFARAGAQGCGGGGTQAGASSLPPAVDRAWEKIGGGPADLTFPDAFIGAWVVNSKLVKVDLPMGMDVLPSALVSRLSLLFEHLLIMHAYVPFQYCCPGCIASREGERGFS